MAKHEDDNRSNQLNPNNDAFWSSRCEEDDDEYQTNNDLPSYTRPSIPQYEEDEPEDDECDVFPVLGVNNQWHKESQTHQPEGVWDHETQTWTQLWDKESKTWLKTWDNEIKAWKD